MNNAKDTAAAAPDLDAADVAAYLVAHPEFAGHHPEAFEAQEIAHEAAGATSLIERQVAVLRQTNRELAARFESLVATARANEERVVELNRVARIMVAAEAVEPLVAALTDCLQTHFAVDQVYIGLGDAAGLAGVAGIDEDGAAARALTNVYRRGKPICGEISAAQASALFETGDEAMLTSAAFIPLGQGSVRGAVVLASTDPKRFTPEMGTLFIELFGKLLTATLGRLVGSDRLA